MVLLSIFPYDTPDFRVAEKIISEIIFPPIIPTKTIITAARMFGRYSTIPPNHAVATGMPNISLAIVKNRTMIIQYSVLLINTEDCSKCFC